MAFLDKLADFFKNNGLVLFLGAAVLAIVGYIVYLYMYGLPPFEPGPVVPHAVKKAKADITMRHEQSNQQAHLTPYSDSDDDFQYLDLSSAIVVPTTNPTNDVQSFTKHVDEYGQVTWEPNVMMDPIDILGEEEFDRAIDGARPGISEGQLRNLTTPSYLKHGNLFWGTPWPEGGPGLCNVRGCPTKEDVMHKGVFSDNTDHGTYGAGNCTF